jgi:hypothetical protein
LTSFQVTTGTWLRCLLPVDVSDHADGVTATTLYDRLQNPTLADRKRSPVMIGKYLFSTQAQQLGALLVNTSRGKTHYSTNPTVARVQLAQNPYVERRTMTTTTASSTTTDSQQHHASVSNEAWSRRYTPDGRGSRSVPIELFKEVHLLIIRAHFIHPLLIINYINK